MKISHWTFFALLAFLLSCTGTKKIEKTVEETILAYESGDFEKSMLLAQQPNNPQRPADGRLLLYAGLSAWELQRVPETIDFLEKAKLANHLTSKGGFTLAQAYLNIDNLSKEITNLEEYIEKFPTGKELPAVHKNLFSAYVKSANWELAEPIWEQLNEADRNQPDFMAQYMKVCHGLSRTEEKEQTAKLLLKLEPNNIEALEVLADKYFWQAENRYQAEMKAYEKNRTNKQYNQLLKALEVINSHYRISRDFYLKLWEIEKKPKYATYLGNIYSRFDNKERANFFYRQAKSN